MLHHVKIQYNECIIGVEFGMERKLKGVYITTPSRLHFSLIDLNGELGRIDGGIGVAIAQPNWITRLEKTSKWSVPNEAKKIIHALQKKISIKNGYTINFESRLPTHVGLGSQTQLALALAHGISILEGRAYTIPDLAQLVGRGGTSGIGLAAYEHGGFILDGGHSIKNKSEFLPSHFSTANPAVLIQRIRVPDDWYFVIAIPTVGQGKYGAEEVKIFKEYCPIPSSEVEKVSRLILMQILPAMIEKDIDYFGDGLNKLQCIGFKRIENQLQHKFINELQHFFLESGAKGIGLSSFGPASFAVIKTLSNAKKLVKKTKEFLIENGQKGSVLFTPANNTGAKIEKF